MTTTVLRPNGALTSGGFTIVPSGTIFGVTSDDSDASYVEIGAGGDISVELTAKTLAAGEITKSVTLRARTSNSGSVRYKVNDPFGVDFVAVSAVGASIATQTILTQAVTWSQSQIDEIELSPVEQVSGTPRVHELYLDLITVVKPVTVVTAVSPNPFTASTSVPIAWTNTLDSDGGAQTRYQVIVTDDDDGDAVVFDSGEVISASTVTTVSPIINGNYTVSVRVAQTVNGASHWSAYATETFTVNGVSSDISTVVGTADDANGNIDVVVTRDGTSEAWELIEVERSFDAGVSWSPVRTATLVDSTGDASTFSVTDHEVPNGQATLFRARATLYSLGEPTTGAWAESASVSWSSSTVEWLKDPLAPSLNIAIESVRWNTQRRSNRAGVFYPLGVADAVVVSDVRTSPSGSIMVRVRGQAEALALDAILAGDGVLLLNLLPDSLVGPGRDGFMFIGSITDDEDWQRQFYADGEPEERLVTLNFAQVARPPDGTAGTL